MSPPTVARRAVTVPPVKLGTLLNSARGKYAVPGRSSTNSFQRSPYSARAWLESVFAVCEPCHWVPSSNSTGLLSTPLVPMDQKPVGVLKDVGIAPSRSSVKSSTIALVLCAWTGTTATTSSDAYDGGIRRCCTLSATWAAAGWGRSHSERFKTARPASTSCCTTHDSGATLAYQDQPG